MKYKVGDIVVGIQISYGIRVGTRLIVTKCPNKALDFIEVQYLDRTNSYKFHVYCEDVVLESVYKSKLFNVLK